MLHKKPPTRPGAVLFVLSFLPAVGTAFVWIPVAAYLFLTGRWLEGSALVAWGTISGGIIGNILYIRLAGNRMRMHDVLALIGYMGGVAIFGVLGIILGPAVFAVTAEVLEVWRQPATDREALPVVAQPAPDAAAPGPPGPGK
ncbi:MAG: AI-2E family transporter [Pirellulaceae bacterium]